MSRENRLLENHLLDRSWQRTPGFDDRLAEGVRQAFDARRIVRDIVHADAPSLARCSAHAWNGSDFDIDRGHQAPRAAAVPPSTGPSGSRVDEQTMSALLAAVSRRNTSRDLSLKQHEKATATDGVCSGPTSLARAPPAGRRRGGGRGGTHVPRER